VAKTLLLAVFFCLPVYAAENAPVFPVAPTVTERGAVLMILLGGFALIGCLIRSLNDKQESFSLRWLLAITITFGLFAGGVARLYWAKQQSEHYLEEQRIYNVLHQNDPP
jgi:hypothetical protein